jgi:hypothetical protein
MVRVNDYRMSAQRYSPVIARKGKQGKISGFDGIATP